MLSTDTSPSQAAEVRSPADLSSIVDPAALRSAVADYVRTKHWAHGYEVLTPFEHTIRLAFECARHEGRGTLLEEALRGNERCSELVAVLEEIGARHAAAALWRAHSLCASATHARAEEIDAVEALLVENEVWDRLLVFLTGNRHRFRPD